MKAIKGYYNLQTLIIGVLLVIASSCKKDEIEVTPILVTADISKIGQFKALCGGIITDDNGSVVNARGICWATTSNPTIANNKTIDGEGAGSFTSELTSLTAGTTYYVRAYATNKKGTSYGSNMVFQTVGNTFTDPRDGNVYKVVTIGDQIWMAENLRYLPSVVGPGAGSETVPFYYVYGYNGTNKDEAKATANYAKYGVLYNWPAAMGGSASSASNPSGVQGACPPGWHLPSDAEWQQLTDYLGGLTLAANKLKEAGTTHWTSPNTGATNETGFTALPAGYRLGNGEFYNIGISGFWSSATEYGAIQVWVRSMWNNSSSVSAYDRSKVNGFSIRCVRD